MLLAIDTSTQIMSIAMHDGLTLQAEYSLNAGRRHSAQLAPLIEQILAQAALTSADLSALAVSVGPGSYTGLRIGVALAKGMAAARDLPLVPVTTLETIAAAQRVDPGDKPLIATVSAGRDRVIWAAYRYVDEGWAERLSPQISSWDMLLESFDCPFVLSGEISAAGWEKLNAARDAGARIDIRPAAERLRRAGYLAEIAWQRLRESSDKRAFPADRVMPIYLKGPG